MRQEYSPRIPRPGIKLFVRAAGLVATTFLLGGGDTAGRDMSQPDSVKRPYQEPSWQEPAVLEDEIALTSYITSEERNQLLGESLEIATAKVIRAYQDGAEGVVFEPYIQADAGGNVAPAPSGAGQLHAQLYNEGLGLSWHRKYEGQAVVSISVTVGREEQGELVINRTSNALHSVYALNQQTGAAVVILEESGGGAYGGVWTTILDDHTGHNEPSTALTVGAELIDELSPWATDPAYRSQHNLDAVKTASRARGVDERVRALLAALPEYAA